MAIDSIDRTGIDTTNYTSDNTYDAIQKLIRISSTNFFINMSIGLKYSFAQE
jgi:hypothetical protein